MTDDPYRVLGVQKDATDAEIKRIYRKLARQHHPDRNPDDAAAEGDSRLFKRLTTRLVQPRLERSMTSREEWRICLPKEAIHFLDLAVEVAAFEVGGLVEVKVSISLIS